MSILNDFIGWSLTLFGVGLILFMIYGAMNSLLLLSMSLSIPATIVFRSGISFLKMNSAYRMAKKLNANTDSTSIGQP